MRVVLVAVVVQVRDRGVCVVRLEVRVVSEAVVWREWAVRRPGLAEPEVLRDRRGDEQLVGLQWALEPE